MQSELQNIIDQITGDGGTILLARINSGSCYGGMASHQATIVYDFEDQKFLWTASGDIVRGEFILMIGRQHPINEEQWLAMKEHHEL